MPTTGSTALLHQVIDRGKRTRCPAYTVYAFFETDQTDREADGDTYIAYYWLLRQDFADACLVELNYNQFNTCQDGAQA
jgi:hypothetical protein